MSLNHPKFGRFLPIVRPAWQDGSDQTTFQKGGWPESEGRPSSSWRANGLGDLPVFQPEE